MEASRRHILPPPYVVKPVNEGSSFRVIIVREERSLPPQELTRPEWPYGDRALGEKYAGGRELTGAIMGDKILDIIEILPSTGAVYHYDAKYAEGGSIHVLPAQIKPNIYRQIQQLTLTAHQALGCRGVSRADFRWDDRPDGTGNSPASKSTRNLA